MAKINLLLQAITPDYHADVLKRLLSASNLQRLVVSIAFVREDGVNALAAQLQHWSKITSFFVGIRNDITSIQAVEKLLTIGVRIFAVDTGSRSTIFHPKLFLAKSTKDASAIIGSANMTFSGLHNNIEAGAILYLSLANRDDAAFVDSTFGLFDTFQTQFPKHVFEIKDKLAAQELFNDGRLVDEDVVIAPSISTSVRRGERDPLRPMKLFKHGSPTRKRKTAKAKPTTIGTPALPAAPSPDISASEFVLIWESRGLTERDLTIPSGGSTHATGSMLWKKGAAEDIDQRHFFRDEVFAGLDWATDASKPHMERAKARFRIIIKGLNYGTFDSFSTVPERF